ncbi:hypothetical protein MXD59_19135 [Frankia sp. Ag45/Mut15]|uniref:Uncharacterized protein n=1 Tax=Frankia umida TaxID=573489 RepID=A0ABT0K250_9ACTN|nr:hypothetical protein [Frankia umida]MCK9877865.1 hypothetical protein [Frankia umida]
MRDHERLLRLISLVAVMDPGQRGRSARLRFADEAEEARWKASLLARLYGGPSPQVGRDGARLALTRLLSSYTGVLHHRDDSESHEGDAADARYLPGYALEAVDLLAEDEQIVIGEMLKRSLSLSRIDPQVIARLWVDDVRATSWRLLVDRDHPPCPSGSPRE